MYIWMKLRPHTHTKCRLRFPLQYHISWNLKVLWVQKRNPDILPFSLKQSRQANPLQVPQRGPYGEKYLLTGHFFLSLNISLFYLSLRVPGKWASSLFPKRVPMGSNTSSPKPLIYYSFIHSFMYVCWSPQKGALLHTFH